LDDTNVTQKWWSDELVRVRNQLGVEFDGIWIDMNEPSNFGTNKDHPWYYDNPGKLFVSLMH
jgi:alpha-glucosidase (family GH31 glycosyl hydrolase)